VAIKWFEDGSAVCKINAHTGEEFILTDNITVKENPAISPNGNFVAYEVSLNTSKGEEVNRIGIVPLNPVGEKEEATSLIKPFFFALYQNYPNPFQRNTVIKYALPEISDLRLVVYDIKGSLVRTLFSGKQKPGFHRVIWDGKDEKGRRVAAGIYFYQLEVKGKSLTRKLLKGR